MSSRIGFYLFGGLVVGAVGGQFLFGQPAVGAVALGVMGILLALVADHMDQKDSEKKD